MKRCMNRVLSLHIALLALILTPVFATDSTLFHIPRIKEIIVDGSGDDWAQNGFRVEFLTDPNGRALPASDFDVKFRLGWNQQGLYILAAIRDDIPVEHENLSHMWQKDCVEIFVGEKVGSTNRYQLVISSGADPQYKKTRRKLYDWRPEDQRIPELASQSASHVLEGGYVIEVVLPWENLGIEPSLGMDLAFQFVANDDDGDAGDSSGPLRVAWFPALDPTNPNNMYGLKLSDKPSKAVLFRIDREIELSRCTVSVRGSSELIGEPVEVRSPEKIITQGKLQRENGRAGVQLHLSRLENADVWPQVDVTVGGKSGATFEVLPFLESILEKYTEALGGRTAIEKLTTRFCTGQLINNFQRRQPPKKTTPLEAYAIPLNKWVLILNLSEGIHREGCDGKVGWRLTSDRIEHVEHLRRARLGWILNPQGALHIQDYFPGLILKREEMLQGRKVFIVEPQGIDRSYGTLYFDVETGMLVQIGNNLELHDYHVLDGIKFPFRIVISQRGGSSTFAFDKVKHNVPVDTALFSIPDPAEVFADAFQGIEEPKILPMLQCKDLSYVHGDMNVPCQDGRFLYDFILQNNYKRGLEIGTFNGYSTLWLGLAFRKTGGRVITIEIDPVAGHEAKKNFLKAGLDDVIDLRINDAFEEIPKIEGKFDFIFIDAWKPDYLKFLRLLRNRILPGGTIIAHNVTNYAHDMRDFLEAIKNDPNLETTFNEISAEGMSISIVRK